MPSIEAINPNNGIQILLGKNAAGLAVGVISLTNTAMATMFSGKTIAQSETLANNSLKTSLTNAGINDQIKVHIWSLNPLRYIVRVANPGYVYPTNWWGIDN
jgi:hypothetical protein